MTVKDLIDRMGDFPAKWEVTSWAVDLDARSIGNKKPVGTVAGLVKRISRYPRKNGNIKQFGVFMKNIVGNPQIITSPNYIET